MKYFNTKMEAKRFYFVELAKEYGLIEAVLLTNIIFWIKKNIKNNNNYYDKRYWTFNSVTSFQKIFPELNERKISYSLQKLESNEVLITGNFNKKKYDKTKWYSLGSDLMYYYFDFFPVYYKEKPIDKFVKWILQFCQMDMTRMSNGYNNFVIPIPDINTDIDTNVNTDTIKECTPQKINYEYYQEKWNKFASLHNLDCIIKMTEKRKSGIKNRLKEKDFDFDIIFENISKSDFLLGKVKDWKVTFDWIFTHKNNYIKILENNYTNNGCTRKPEQRNFAGNTKEKWERIFNNSGTDGNQKSTISLLSIEK